MSRKTIILIVAGVFIAVGAFLGKDFFFSKTGGKAGLQVKSNPSASIFLNSNNLGETPYQEKLQPGEYELKLIPEDGNSAASWQGKIKLTKGTQTYVDVNLGSSDIASSWIILSLEKVKKKETEVAVFSKTDTAQVFLDGEKKGTVPLSFRKVSPGNHELKLTADGFSERTIKIKINKGYKLKVESQLALLEKSAQEKPGEEKNAPNKKELQKPYVLIGKTPTGWLRVREKPSIASKELTKVKPGEKYPYLDKSKGWFKIEYEKDKEGWLSGRYAQKVE